jgi:hypothetical protein
MHLRERRARPKPILRRFGQSVRPLTGHGQQDQRFLDFINHTRPLSYAILKRALGRPRGVHSRDEKAGDMRVLLIEDYSATTQSIKLMLESANFDVQPTDLGEEGVDLDDIRDKVIRTMYRILAANQEVRERRDHLRHPVYKKPELLAQAPNGVWSWDITKLMGPAKWTSHHDFCL